MTNPISTCPSLRWTTCGWRMYSRVAWTTSDCCSSRDQAMTVYLNGKFMPIEEAKVPVLDRGFVFGDGVYEVIPVYARTPLRMKEHLARLAYGLGEIRIANP